MMGWIHWSVIREKLSGTTQQQRHDEKLKEQSRKSTAIRNRLQEADQRLYFELKNTERVIYQVKRNRNV